MMRRLLIAAASVHVNEVLRAPDPNDRKDKGEYKRRIYEPGQSLVDEDGTPINITEKDEASLIRDGYVTVDPAGGSGVSGRAADVPQKPKAKAERMAAIGGAMKGLDPNNEEHFTRSGVPSTSALHQVLGWDVSGAERDEAWALVKPPK